jgi:hypothetical protein
MTPQTHGFNSEGVEMGCVSYYVIIFIPGSKMWIGSGLMTVFYGEGELGEKRMLERNRRSKKRKNGRKK